MYRGGSIRGSEGAEDRESGITAGESIRGEWFEPEKGVHFTGCILTLNLGTED